MRTRREAGEIFIRRRPRLLSDGLPVPIQYQLLEPEFCRVNYNLTFNGERVYAGIGSVRSPSTPSNQQVIC